MPHQPPREVRHTSQFEVQARTVIPDPRLYAQFYRGVSWAFARCDERGGVTIVWSALQGSLRLRVSGRVENGTAQMVSVDVLTYDD
jgi:hypothetical protein